MRIIVTTIALLIVTGCSGRPSLIPNPDPQLRKSSAEFAADAAKRFPYHTDAAHGTTTARCQVNYNLPKVIDIANLSDEDWHNVEVWVNRQYVVFVPEIKSHDLKRLPFEMIFDDSGHTLPTDSKGMRVETVEVYMGGKMYNVPVKLAD
jgi:hypothetical protein